MLSVNIQMIQEPIAGVHKYETESPEVEATTAAVVEMANAYPGRDFRAPKTRWTRAKNGPVHRTNN